jgi:hypothetical protein
VEHLKYLDSMITNDARCAHEIKFKIAIAKEAFSNKFSSIWTYIEGRNL